MSVNKGNVENRQVTTWTSVFISYSHRDKVIATKLTQGLHNAGCRVWIDEGEMLVGDSIIEKIAEAVDQVRFVLALISENSILSPWCRKELAIAIHGSLDTRRIRVLPLRIGEVEIPSSLRDVFYLQIDPQNLDDAVARLVNNIRSHLSEELLSGQLAPTSALSDEEIRQMRFALRSHEDDPPLLAADALVCDRSIPATAALFEEAVADAVSGTKDGPEQDSLRLARQPHRISTECSSITTTESSVWHLTRYLLWVLRIRYVATFCFKGYLTRSIDWGIGSTAKCG